MNKRLKIIIALLIGFMSALIAVSYVNRRERQLLSMATPINVVVASIDLPRGHVITEDDLRLMEVPQRFVQPGYFTNPSELVHRIVLARVQEGETLTQTRVAISEIEALSAKLPAGQRAVTLSVSDVSGVAGLISPGDAVDVLGIFELGRSTRDKVTEARVILQNVFVAATDQNIGGVADLSEEDSRRARGTYATVTLAISPTDAQRLVLAQEVGRLFLVLRSSRELEDRLAFEILTPQKLLETDLPIWSQALQEAEFQEQLLNQSR